MVPDWVVRILESGGVWGAITFILMLTVAGLATYVRSMQAKADKVYGYRLAERDTLNKVLTDTANVIAGIIKANEERNDLTEEQAQLIREQAHAFELLKATVLAQYDNIKDHNSAMVQTISAMAEGIRVLNSLMLENRTIAHAHVLDVKNMLSNAESKIKSAISEASQAQLLEMRSLLGVVKATQRKRRVAK